ncbi:MAG: hypothetical protein ACLFRG_11575 [Desulfococcaceae bacterium]
MELPQSEQNFIDELRFMLADDGIIDPNERSILARKQKKLKITDERAQELEDMIMTGAVYSANAREYFEELEALFQEKPDLSPANRRLLDRLVKQLGLDEDIVDEIEKIARAKHVSE